jgi:protein gp37
MGANSEIGWTTHTFNPWTGCTKVSPGCQFCYAERLSNREMGVIGRWGPKGTRKVTADSYWAQPARWNRWAQEGICLACKGKGSVKRKSPEMVTADNPKGVIEEACAPCGGLGKGAPRRDTVFCASLADVFEGSETMPAESWLAVCAARDRLFNLIEQTPNLNWLLLTKRPEKVMSYVPERWHVEQKGFPSNVWIGTSVEDQKAADERIPYLLEVPAVVRFLSCEPLLGAIDFFIPMTSRTHAPAKVNVLAHRSFGPQPRARIDWIICGGESGPQARPMHPDWVRSLRDQCERSRTPFFYKQWGEFAPVTRDNPMPLDRAGTLVALRTDGTRSESLSADVTMMWRPGKQVAGRLLDGREWNEFPKVLSCVQSVG